VKLNRAGGLRLGDLYHIRNLDIFVNCNWVDTRWQ